MSAEQEADELPHGFHTVDHSPAVDRGPWQAVTIQTMARNCPPPLVHSERQCHTCACYFVADVPGEMRCPVHREKRPQTVVLAHCWIVEPSAESERPELRESQSTAIRDVSEGECRWCGGTRELNYRDECGGCWSQAVKWLPPDDRQLRRAPSLIEALNAANVVRGRSMGNYYQPPPRRDPPKWRERPWQRYRWQVEERRLPHWDDDSPIARRRRIAIARTAPERLHPQHGCGVQIRCLVCLRLTDKLKVGGKTDTLRADQVCGNCDDRWRDAGWPWREDYELFVMRRRSVIGKKSGDHLSAYWRADLYVEFARPRLTENKPLTRGTTEVSFEVRDNSKGRTSGSAPFLLTTSLHEMQANGGSADAAKQVSVGRDDQSRV